ncbi:MAG: flavodoxin-dependent (E)-4-hydroxy-3-methylbut-2-enyl-diphosphate synthase [Firmicutes bacterium]|nr:flavodoxin-dependent (E)-4-hydroxy-3-methylbut-2-enyl-diphosphate synthase [Bacillota bacterium]
MYTRSNTRQVKVGGLALGGGAPVRIQSMTNTRTSDVEATVRQILELEEAGCEIIRATVPDMASAEAFRKIRERIHIPLVADIHFDYRLAIAAVEHGADKIRINPGNIGSPDRVRAVAEACKAHHVPIRVGVNSGSLERELLAKYGGPTAEALAESAAGKVRQLEECGFSDMVVSIKASTVNLCVDANLAFADKYDYPLHLGITEAGGLSDGTVKSAMGLGALLHAGLGDTIRVSLTADPVEEIRTAKQILRFAGLRNSGIEWVSCPTCGRTSIDLVKLADEAREALKDETLPVRIAVMGCIVNGPGEAREADLGIAGGNGEGLIFRKGEILRKVPENELLPALLEEFARLKDEMTRSV